MSETAPLTVLRGEIVDSTLSGPSRADFAAMAFLARYRVESTRKGYGLSLRQWFVFCEEHFIDPLAAQRPHIEIWARELEERGLMLSTIAAKLTAVAGFYRLAVADGLIDKDPSTHVVRPMIERVSTTLGLTRPEFADMLAAAKASSLQDYALIRLMGVNGLRVSEMCGLNVEDLERVEGQVVAHLRRKGEKRSALPLPPRTSWVLEQLVDGRKTGPVFRSRMGNRLDKKAAGRVVKRIAKTAGITKRIHPHSLRHTFVTMARDSGVPDREIIATTGHADSRMVDYYDRASKIELARNATSTVDAFVERAT